MIFVKLDRSLIPEEALKKAEDATKKLEKQPESNRKQFIKRCSAVWSAFGPSLAKMSHGKCWYSESPEPHSFFDVDHFRPKGEAKRSSDTDVDEGYPWLAFEWSNYRYSASRANRLSTDSDTDEVIGKGSWFPLEVDSPKATWSNRCISSERPTLLDPTLQRDVDLIDVDADSGRMRPSRICLTRSNQQRVKRSVELYGLDSPQLVEARRRIIRDLQDDCENLLEIITEKQDLEATMRIVAKLRRATSSKAPYARAARAKLFLHNLGEFCAHPEDDCPP